MVDIHTHIIYDVDDGSDTLSESVAILKEAVKYGITEVIFTPHYIDSGTYDKEKVIEHYNIIKEEIRNQDIPIRAYLGNEVAVYGNINEILENEDISTLADSKYMLIEFPMNVDVNYVVDTVYEMKIKNRIPIIAHPERCECFRKHYNLIKEAAQEGALIQCNTGSLTGVYGDTARKIVKKLLKEGLVHFMSTDTHSIKNTRYENLMKAEVEVEKIVGRFEKNKLFTYNPRKILIDENIEG